MHTALSRTLLSCLVGILLGSCAGPEERAQQLLGEASRLVFSAQEAEKTSYADALPLYRQASAKAETITAHYALSPLAGKLTSGEAKIGSYSLTELRDVVVPRVELRAQAESNPLACALLVASTIPDVHSRANAIAHVAVAYDEAGRHDQVLQLVKTTRDEVSRSQVVSELIARYINVGQYDQAVRVVAAIEDAALRDWALAWIGREAAARGQYDRAFAVAAMLRSKAEVLVNIASAYTREGKREKAAEVLLQALEAIHTLQEPKEAVLGQIARGYAAVGHYPQALEVAAMIAEPLYKADILADIASKQVEAGHYDSALQLTDTIGEGFAKYKALISIADKLAQAGHRARAADVLGSALAVARALDGASLRARRMSVLPRPYATIAPGLVDSFQVEATAEIASKYVALGQLEHALQLARAVGDAHAEQHVLTTMARRYVEGVSDDQVGRIVETISDSQFREKVAEAITERAAERAQQAWEQEARQQDPDEQAKRLVNSVRQYAEVGQYDHALAIAHTIPESFYQTQALAAIADKYIAEGQYDRALALTPTMENDRKAGMLSKIAFQYATAGPQDKASMMLAQALQIAQASKRIHTKASILTAITEALAAVGVSSAQRGQPVESGGAKKLLHMIVSGLGDNVGDQAQLPLPDERDPRGIFGYGRPE